jgi:hypothetical protein
MVKHAIGCLNQFPWVNGISEEFKHAHLTVWLMQNIFIAKIY